MVEVGVQIFSATTSAWSKAEVLNTELRQPEAL